MYLILRMPILLCFHFKIICHVFLLCFYFVFYLEFLSLTGAGYADIPRRADNFNMMKTIIIAVCSAVAYLAIVIGLTVYCSIRLVKAKNLRKQKDKDNATGAIDSFNLPFCIFI